MRDISHAAYRKVQALACPPVLAGLQGRTADGFARCPIVAADARAAVAATKAHAGNRTCEHNADRHVSQLLPGARACLA